jgi:hypothetical protein
LNNDPRGEPTSLKLLGAHLVREIEKLSALGFDGELRRAFRLKEVELSVPFIALEAVAPEAVVIGGEAPLTPLEALDRLDRVKAIAFIEAGRIAGAPADSITMLRLRMKF